MMKLFLLLCVLLVNAKAKSNVAELLNDDNGKINLKIQKGCTSAKCNATLGETVKKGKFPWKFLRWARFYLGQRFLKSEIKDAKPIKHSKKKNEVTILQSDLTYKRANRYIFGLMVPKKKKKSPIVQYGKALDGTSLTLRKESKSESGPTLDFNNNKGHIYKIRLIKDKDENEDEDEDKDGDDEIDE